MYDDILTELSADEDQQFDMGDFQAQDSSSEDQPEEEVDEKESEPKSDETEDEVSEDEEQETDEPSEEGNNTPPDDKVPFDKHPRFKSLLKTVKTLKEQNAGLEIEKQKRELLEQKLDQLINARDLNNNESEISDEFVKLFGDNKEAYKLFSKMTKKEAAKLIDDKFSERDSVKTEQQKAQEETRQHFESVMSELAEDTGLDLTNEDDPNRNAILKVAKDYQPSDSQGRIDLKKAYELWKVLEVKQTKNSTKKKVAGMTNGDTSTDTTEEEAPKTFGFSKRSSVFDLLN